MGESSNYSLVRYPRQTAMYPTKPPPIDQRIVDEYFHLAFNRKNRHTAWLMGMLATYGLKPEELKGFTWNANSTINIKNKKRPIRPLHPQWVFLFDLKKKQPSNLESCWDKCLFNLYRLMASAEISVNVTDLILSYKMRKAFYNSKTKQQQVLLPVFA